MIYVLDDVTSPELNKELEEYFDNTELESIEATVDYFKPESYHFSKYEKDIPCHTNIFEDFSPVVEKFAPVIRAMIPIVGDVHIVASRFNLVDNPKSQNHTPFHRDFVMSIGWGFIILMMPMDPLSSMMRGMPNILSLKEIGCCFFQGSFML